MQEYATGSLVVVKNYGPDAFKVSGWVQDSTTFDSPVTFYFIEGIEDNVFRAEELSEYVEPVDPQYPLIPWKD